MRVLFVQLPLPSPVQEADDANQPLAAALLLSHAGRAGALAGVDAAILPPELVSAAGDRALVRAIADYRPDLLCCSVTMWNVDRTLWVANRVRERLPQLTVLLGGPEVTPDNARLHAAPGWDLLAVGEGEQAFTDLLRQGLSLADPRHVAPLPAGLVGRGAPGEPLRLGPPARALENLDALEPYRDGWLAVPVGSEALVETTRGCLHRCRYCYYPKAHPKLTALSLPVLREQVRFLRDRGASGLYLLDPTITDRPDLGALLALLAEENQGRLALFGELRGEEVTPALAEQLARAGFVEVEVGLQSTNPRALAAVGRRSDTVALARGLQALQQAGIRPTLDLIVGLPGDDRAGARESLRYVHEQGLSEHVQVFTLSLLPGTALRADAARLGLVYHPDPPYHVQETPELGPLDLLQTLDLAEELFEVELDAAPLPVLSQLPAYRSLLDEPVPAEPLASHTLWCRVADPLLEAERIGRRAAAHLEQEPFCTLGVVIETGGPFPFDAYDRIYAQLAPWTDRYLDRLHGRRGSRRAWSVRLVVVLPWGRRAQVPGDWLEDGLELADPVWRLPLSGPEPLVGLLAEARLRPWETVLAELSAAGHPAGAAREAWLRELSWGLDDAEQLVFADPELQQDWSKLHAAGRGRAGG